MLPIKPSDPKQPQKPLANVDPSFIILKYQKTTYSKQQKETNKQQHQAEHKIFN